MEAAGILLEKLTPVVNILDNYKKKKLSFSKNLIYHKKARNKIYIIEGSRKTDL